MQGVVKWFNNEKGFGFIKAGNDARDIFVHFKEIQVDGYKTLKDGDKVEFTFQDSPKGPVAKGVSLVTDN
jgi:CspA family cold shock protein